MSEVQRWVGGEVDKGEVEKKERVGGIRREMRHWNCLISLGNAPTSSLKNHFVRTIRNAHLPPQNMLQ